MKRVNWIDFSGMIEMDNKGIFMKLFLGEERKDSGLIPVCQE